ncbi:MAG: hypothetical protein JWQ87_787 [Candidatus Sulfotelmatobacter sp.]|nr:hypothetical protein [Candidatus Sulfotelmatobacter sp.]
MRAVIVAEREPFKTYYWILAETGLRAGEIGALTVAKLLLEQGAIRISQSVWRGTIQTVKSRKGNRICEISPLLVGHLRSYARSWRPNPSNLLFATRNGTPWDIDTIRKRKLCPLLEKLGIEALRFPCVSSRQSDRDGSGAGRDSYPSKSTRSVPRANNDGIHARNYRRWTPLRGAPRATADDGLCLNFGPNWASIVFGGEAK